MTYIKILLGNTSKISTGSVLTVVLNEILMPPTLCPLDGIIVYTGDSEYFEIEYATYATITNTLPGDETTVDYTSAASITTLTGVLEENQTYEFNIYTTGDIPMDGLFTLKIPTEVGLPSDPDNDFVLTCTQNCDESTITLTYSSSLRLLTFSGVVPDASSYIMAPGPIVFSI